MTSKELLWPSSITLTKLLMVTYCFLTNETPFLSPRTMSNFKLGRSVDPLIPDKPKLERKDYPPYIWLISIMSTILLHHKKSLLPAHFGYYF